MKLAWIPLPAAIALAVAGTTAHAQDQAGNLACTSTPSHTKLCRRGVAPSAPNAEATPQSTSSFEVFRDVTKFLESWVEYNPSTCAFVSSGEWFIATAPTYGTPTTRIDQGTLNNGDCPGVTFPFDAIYYTWTSSQKGPSQDTFTATWASPDFSETDTFDLTRIPVIKGAHTLWWFDGEEPSGYPVRTTLTANTSSYTSYTWTITSGMDHAVFANFSDHITTSLNHADILSFGAGRRKGDVHVVVNVAGQDSDPFAITVRAPTSLMALAVNDLPYPRPPIRPGGYESDIHYRILDQWGVAFPAKPIALNEQFTAAPMPDFIAENWVIGKQMGWTMNAADWYDEVHNGYQDTPPSLPPSTPPDNVKIDHWPGTWRIGSTTVGLGRPVQTNTWQRYQDHARHESIVTPVP